MFSSPKQKRKKARSASPRRRKKNVDDDTGEKVDLAAKRRISPSSPKAAQSAGNKLRGTQSPKSTAHFPGKAKPEKSANYSRGQKHVVAEQKSRARNASPRSPKKRGDTAFEATSEKRGPGVASRSRARAQHARQLARQQQREKERKAEEEARAALKEARELREQEEADDRLQAALRGQGDDGVWEQAIQSKQLLNDSDPHPPPPPPPPPHVEMAADEVRKNNGDLHMAITEEEATETYDQDAVETLPAAAQTWSLNELSAVVPVAEAGMEYDSDVDDAEANGDAVAGALATEPAPRQYGEANVDLYHVVQLLHAMQHSYTPPVSGSAPASAPAWKHSENGERLEEDAVDDGTTTSGDDVERDGVAAHDTQLPPTKHQWTRLSTASAAESLSSDLLALLEAHLAADDNTLRVLAGRGIRTAEDLQFVDEEDLVAAGCRRVLARKLAQIASLIGANAPPPLPPPLNNNSIHDTGHGAGDEDGSESDRQNIDGHDDDDEDDRERDFSMLEDEDEYLDTGGAGGAKEYSSYDQNAVAEGVDYADALEPTTANARRLVTQANQLAGAHQYELALEKYYTALELYDLLNAQFADIDGGDGQQRLDTQKDTAKTLNNLAAVLHQLKRFDEAMEAYSQALETKKMSLGQDHFSVGHTLYNMACLQLDYDRPADAAHFMRQTLAIYESAFGLEHQLTCDVHNQLNLIMESARTRYGDLDLDACDGAAQQQSGTLI